MRFEIKTKIPDGYEPTGEFRPPKRSDGYFLTEDGQLVLDTHNWHWLPLVGCRLILRKKWTPPKCLPEGIWLYQAHRSNTPEPDGWYVSSTEPDVWEDGYAIRGGSDNNCPAKRFVGACGEEFIPPPVQKIQVRHG